MIASGGGRFHRSRKRQRMVLALTISMFTLLCLGKSKANTDIAPDHFQTHDAHADHLVDANRRLQTASNKPLNYFDQPKVKFITHLPGTGSTSQPGIRRNNAVVLSPDEKRLYATLTDGALHVLDPSRGTRYRVFRPKPYADGWSTECKSGVDFYMDEGTGISFLVYNIVDIGPQGQKQSHVIALSHPTLKLLWVSEPLEGEVAGNPAITSSGDYIFLTRNIEDGTIGHFTILSVAEGGKVVFDEASDSDREEDRAPYGPLGLAKSPPNGANWDQTGVKNTNDVAWWAHSTDSGRADDGLTKGFQFPADFDGTGFASMEVVRLKPVSWSTTNSPTFSKDGKSVYFTGTRAGIRAWIDGRDGNMVSSWSASLTRKENNGLQPLFSGVTLAPDEMSIYIASATKTVAKVLSKTGLVSWEQPSTSVVLGRAAVSPDNNRVYFIEVREGTVVARDTGFGKKLWSIGCTDYLDSESCSSHTVEGEFTLSQSGEVLYFGNRVGQIIALEVGQLPTRAPTPVPTARPTTMSPTLKVTEDPTAELLVTAEPTLISETQGPTKEEGGLQFSDKDESSFESGFQVPETPSSAIQLTTTLRILTLASLFVVVQVVR